MAEQTENRVYRHEIAEELKDFSTTSKWGRLAIVDTVFDAIRSFLVAGKEVEITKFGTFYVADNAPRVRTNPATGEKVSIPAKKQPRIRYSEIVKKCVNK